MPFLLAAVELTLALLVLWSLNGALSSIDNKLKPRAQSQHLRDISGFSSWQGSPGLAVGAPRYRVAPPVEMIHNRVRNRL
jgi:hypothetical protein